MTQTTRSLEELAAAKASIYLDIAQVVCIPVNTEEVEVLRKGGAIGCTLLDVTNVQVYRRRGRVFIPQT